MPGAKNGQEIDLAHDGTMVTENSQMAARRRVQLPDWPASPPLTPIETLSTLALTPPWNYTLTPPQNPRQAFERFMQPPLPADLETRPLGNLNDLMEVHRNVAYAVHLEPILRDFLLHVRPQGDEIDRHSRLIVATKLIGCGAGIVNTCHVLCLREDAFSRAAALGQLRIGIELVARGGWVALGVGNEPRRIIEGPSLPTEEQRFAARPGNRECMRVIAPVATRRWGTCDAPTVVYEWLCRYTHFDGSVVDELFRREPTATTAYAATAYVAWLAAVVAEIVMGGQFANPPRLPDPPPWRVPH